MIQPGNPLADAAPRRGERNIAMLVAGFTALCVIAIVANLIYELAQAHSSVLTQNTKNATVLTQVLEEQTVDSMHAVELAFQTTITALQSTPVNAALVDRMLAGSVKNLPFVRALWVLDADGNMIHDSDKLPGKYNLADRSYFKVHRDEPARGLYIDDPVVSKLGVPFIGLSRRINRADGSFGGVVVAALEPQYLRRFYTSIKVGAQGMVSLVKTDRTLLLRVPSPAGSEGKMLPSFPRMTGPSAAPPSGTFSARSAVDGVQRIYFYRRVADLPLVVVVGLGEEDMFADWRSTAQGYVAVSVAFLLVIAWLCYLTLRELRRRNALHHALGDSDQALNAAQRLALIGSWRLDFTTMSGQWSQQMYPLLAMEPGSTPPRVEAFLERLHPDDRGLIVSAVQERREWSGELRSNPALGPQRYFQARSTAVRNHQGEVTALLGTLQDVTARHQADDKLQLASRVFEQTRDGIVVTDAGGRIVAVNAAFERITLYREADVIGKNIRMLRSNSHDAREYHQLWQGVRSEGHWRGEVWSRRKNGEVFPQWLSVNAVSNTDQRDAGFVGVFTDLSEITEANERVQFLVNHDPLTRLPNRALLNDRLEQAIEAAQSGRRQVAVLLLNIDRLQRVNDSIGHDAGDTVLREMAQRLMARLQPGDTLARIGSDEFVMVLTHVDDTDDINASAQQLLGAISATCTVSGHELIVTASIGIAAYPLDGSDPSDLIKNADTALSHVKNSGRNSFRYFTAEMNTHALHWMSLEHRLRSALARDEFALHFQPQMRLADNTVCGSEALIRWHSGELGMVAPNEFIPLAEDTGLIVEIGAWVIHTACAQSRRWQDGGLPALPIAVNVSALQITAGTLPAIVREALAQNGLAPGCLAIELTESVLMQEADIAMRQIAELRAMGVAVALDDFGTGYSSLSYLSRFALDKLKIDQSFVRNITNDPKSAAIAKATIALAHGLGIAVVAEGVETLEQLDYLRAAGCDEVQGYYFSRPVAAGDFAAFLGQPARL